jgi:hypothetical protein
MMSALLLYAYCNGVYSSRRIAKSGFCIQNLPMSTSPKLCVSAIIPMIDEKLMMRRTGWEACSAARRPASPTF